MGESISRLPGRKPLAACVAALFSIAAPAAMAAGNIWTVNSCAEGVSGSSFSGTLRYAVANAANTAASINAADTIDLSALPGACNSTITLTTGAISVSQNFLNFKGATGGTTITAKGSPVQDRVVNHIGTGTLNLTDINVSYGNLVTAGTARGGGIYSHGSVSLQRSTISHCAAHSTDIPNGHAYGGGVFAAHSLSAKYSVISGNTTYAATRASTGGGVYVHDGIMAKYSTISGNSAGGLYGSGGGAFVYGNATSSFNTTTISGNTARNIGGLELIGTGTVTISNSTISGNKATTGTIGGAFSSVPLTVRNSTIAFNTAHLGRVGSAFPFDYFAPGLALGADTPITTTLQSTLIANNTYGTASENDISAGDHNKTGNVTIAGNNNLVRANFSDITLPAGTLRLSCPLLGPLRDNGGPTKTHALLSYSPGIDQGNNVATALNYDQRGSPYARVDGALADIGAYEVQQADIVFNTGFDGCPTLY